MNPYFELDSPESLDGWTALADFLETPAVRARVAATRAALGDGPLRAAASVEFLGLAARLVSPVLVSLIRTGTAPALALDTVWCRPVTPGPMRLAFTASDRTRSLDRAVVEPVVMPALEAYASTFAVSRKVLLGNVASARNGAALQLGGGDPGFVRDSCCLIYRFPGRGLCGDCVLRTRSR